MSNIITKNNKSVALLMVLCMLIFSLPVYVFAAVVGSPVLSLGSTSLLTTTTANLNFTSDKEGTYFYLVYEGGDVAPNADTIAAQGVAIAKGTDDTFATANAISVTGLTAATPYKAYVVVEDASTNKSDILTLAFTTAVIDVTAPVLSLSSASAITATTAKLNFTSNEVGTYYYLVYPAEEVAPDADTVTAQGVAISKGTDAVLANANTVDTVGLSAATEYKAYIIVEDASSNKSALLTIPFTTTILDVTAPVLSLSSASALTATTAKLNFTSSKVGTYYYLIYANGDVAPDADTVIAQGVAITKGTAPALAAANTVNTDGLSAATEYNAFIIVEDASLNKSALLTILFTTTNGDALVIGAEIAGGAGFTRVVTASTLVGTLDGKYLVVQFTEGTGITAKVSVVLIPANAETKVSYQVAGTMVDVWLTSGMPDLVAQNMGVSVFANASTNP